ncbi:hypothetical protein M222_2101 [Enterococcus faecalis AZ19]|nr:hypothetical protein M222_2101 [Enterococcus faecalis AZ19]
MAHFSVAFNTIIEEIKNGIHSGAIVLMHDIQAATAEALPDVY